MSGREYLGIPREKIPWKPIIDESLCIGCGQCLETCPNAVYSMDQQSGKAKVSDPDNCVVLCDKCARFCPSDAISFPDVIKTRNIVTDLLREKGDVIK